MLATTDKLFIAILSMSEDRLITLAIHTYEKAVMLKTLLENEGVPVVLHNVNLTQPVVSSGVRVRIKEKDLPLSLRIVENTDIFTNNDKIPLLRQKVIVPIDFSDYSYKAAKIAFHIAQLNNASIIFLHAFIDPFFNENIQLSSNPTYELELGEARKMLEKEISSEMLKFTDQIKQDIKLGEIPPIKFTTDIREGVPEDVITEYAKQSMPMLIVMGTRGAGKKEKELIGSVTAEVLDSCRVPVFSVPELSLIKSINDIKNILFFSNLDQGDIIALDSLHRLFPNCCLHITLVQIADKKRHTPNNAINALTSYCINNFENHSFSSETLKPKNILDEFKNIEKSQKYNLIVVPNKKKNIFSRLFNPSLAHRMLFNADVPMMVIPV